MLNITDHQRNENINHNKSHTSECLSSINQQIECVDEDVEEKETLVAVGGDTDLSSYCRKQYGGSSKN